MSEENFNQDESGEGISDFSPARE